MKPRCVCYESGSSVCGTQVVRRHPLCAVSPVLLDSSGEVFLEDYNSDFQTYIFLKNYVS